MEPIRVEVRRNGVVEAVHRVHAVATDGRVAGDPDLVTYMRSSAKPIQALPLARARVDLDERDLAIASASHPAEPAHVEAVRALLAKAPAAEEDLECGGGIVHNCSGKHAGMLALCRAEGWETQGYRLPAHPCQAAMLEAVAEAVGAPPVASGVDGCGVVTFAYPLRVIAAAFARFESLPAAERVAAAMRARPELVGRAAGPDVRLMQLRRGWIAKGGAAALLCAAGDGIGVALKAEDGGDRALGPALAAFLGDLDGLAIAPVENSRGDRVGEIVAAA